MTRLFFRPRYRKKLFRHFTFCHLYPPENHPDFTPLDLKRGCYFFVCEVECSLFTKETLLGLHPGRQEMTDGVVVLTDEDEDEDADLDKAPQSSNEVENERPFSGKKRSFNEGQTCQTEEKGERRKSEDESMVDLTSPVTVSPEKSGQEVLEDSPETVSPENSGQELPEGSTEEDETAEGMMEVVDKLIKLQEKLASRKATCKVSRRNMELESMCEALQQTADIQAEELETERGKIAALLETVEKLTGKVETLGEDIKAEKEKNAVLTLIVKNADKAFSIERRKLLEANLALEAEKERRTCTICLTRPRNTLLFPCGHFDCCVECVQKQMKRNNKCPISITLKSSP